MLFSRLDEKETLEILRSANKKDEPEIPKPDDCCEQITIDDFMNTELRTAKIIACEPVPKAKKLLKLQLDLGYEKRQVVSGIAECYKPEELIGKKIIVVANLKPVTLCGVDSFGMILRLRRRESY